MKQRSSSAARDGYVGVYNFRPIFFSLFGQSMTMFSEWAAYSISRAEQ